MTPMLPLLAAFLLDWNHPADLVRDLAHDSIAVRERAASELYRRGNDLRPFLMEALETVTDLEIRDRLQGVVRRLDVDDRIRDFGGHNRVCGFAAQLRSDRWYGSGPFRLTLEVMNVGTTDRVFPGIGIWDLELPDQELRSTGAEARVSVRKFIGGSGLRRTSWQYGSGSVRMPLHLRPGEVARFETVLDAKSLPAGEYQATVEYNAPDLIPDAEEKLRTNTVRLTIRK